MENNEVQNFFAKLASDESLVRIKQYVIVEINTLWAIFRDDRLPSIDQGGVTPLDVYFQKRQDAIDYAVDQVLSDKYDAV